MLLDIVILPPKSLADAIGKGIKQATERIRSSFIVDNENLLIHNSLFHIRTSKSNLKKLIPIVERICKKYKPFQISSLGLVRKSDILSVKLTRPHNFQKLHEDIVLNCYKLRTSPMPWTFKPKKPGKLEFEYRKKYGTQHIFRLKHPHFTLAQLQRVLDAKKIEKKFKFRHFTFLAKTVAICEVNYWHQVTKILKTVKII